ncbi:MAG TPA: hypothetical protein VGV61_15740 [Thermoanaerobaculia bacterium]|jgi:hypothetical protein|nr:hypothetical protein [Thermoanaerobaculia bacterium]
MRRIHLLRVAEEAHVFGPLLVAAAAAGLRIGWLELQSPPPLPEALRAALLAGGDRAVAVAAEWTLSARPRKGPALMRELLRQQFLGCALVLVRGEVEAPLLAPADDGGWRLAFPAAAERRLTIDQLLAELRQPQPFAPFLPVT